MSQLSAWASQAKNHWREFRPTRYKELKAAGTLDEAVAEAARLTEREMDELTAAGFQEHEAWEMVRERYLFPPEEESLRKKWDKEPAASSFGDLFNLAMQIQSEMLQREIDPETGEEIPPDEEMDVR